MDNQSLSASMASKSNRHHRKTISHSIFKEGYNTGTPASPDMKINPYFQKSKKSTHHPSNKANGDLFPLSLAGPVVKIPQADNVSPLSSPRFESSYNKPAGAFQVNTKDNKAFNMFQHNMTVTTKFERDNIDQVVNVL
jgi:hypothetical protein